MTLDRLGTIIILNVDEITLKHALTWSNCVQYQCNPTKRENLGGVNPNKSTKINRAWNVGFLDAFKTKALRIKGLEIYWELGYYKTQSLIFPLSQSAPIKVLPLEKLLFTP